MASPIQTTQVKGTNNRKTSPLDWECPSCHASVFAKKDACYKCKFAKPQPQPTQQGVITGIGTGTSALVQNKPTKQHLQRTVAPKEAINTNNASVSKKTKQRQPPSNGKQEAPTSSSRGLLQIPKGLIARQTIHKSRQPEESSSATIAASFEQLQRPVVRGMRLRHHHFVIVVLRFPFTCISVSRTWPGC